jgi:hypothetical protein
VKIITHSSADDARISQELALSLSFDHPNLVRALHYAKLRCSPGSDLASLVSGSCYNILVILVMVGFIRGEFRKLLATTSKPREGADDAKMCVNLGSVMANLVSVHCLGVLSWLFNSVWLCDGLLCCRKLPFNHPNLENTLRCSPGSDLASLVGVGRSCSPVLSNCALKP